MKGFKKPSILLLAVILACCSLFCACGVSGEILEENFFLSMTNIQYYPQNYTDVDIKYDCFTYRLTDVNGKDYICGVRQCSSGYGCNCGNDTIIGFLLDYGGTIPEPKNQSEKSVEKTWVHIVGKLQSATPKEIEIYAYKKVGDGYEIDTTAPHEKVNFLTLKVSELSLISDYRNLKYYVTK